ncbi:MAG: hypothetical protein LBK63_06925 [Treponema sp.]|jgi:hypothetical protein|nr:hypothetical protein [Treponema sp.]
MSYFFDNVTSQDIADAPDGGGFSQFPVGENVAFIASVEEQISKQGNPMLEIIFEGNNDEQIRWYIVDGEYKLKKLKNLFTSFSIPFNLFDYHKWIGSKGIIVIKAGDVYNGTTYNKVSHCRSLKPEQPPSKPEPHSQQAAAAPSTTPSDDVFKDEIPF